MAAISAHLRFVDLEVAFVSFVDFHRNGCLLAVDGQKDWFSRLDVDELDDEGTTGDSAFIMFAGDDVAHAFYITLKKQLGQLVVLIKKRLT